LQVAVRVRPLHPQIELGHEHVIQTFEKHITVKSDLHHDLKATFDVVLDEYSQTEVFS
jgi:hypothetical protein